MAATQVDAAVEAAVGRLADQLDELARIVRFEPALLALRVERVSKWSVGQQVDHIVKVLEAGLRSLEGARETLPRGINVVGRVLIAARWLPRGIARSPKGVLPDEVTPPDLAERVARLRRSYCDTRIPEAVLADPRPVFPHPRFRGLNAAQGLRFLDCHTHHHLKIVGDIRRAAPDRSTT